MSIIEKLSSQVGDRTEDSNKRAAVECIKNPSLLSQINDGLLGKDSKLSGDCAEVATNVAMENSFLVIPLTGNLFRLLEHKNTRARWEAAHALSLVSEHIPDDVSARLPLIHELAIEDTSIIVRDYAADIISNYAKAGKNESKKAIPILKEILFIYDGRHAGHALNGLKHVASFLPEYRNEIADICMQFQSHKKAVISKTAKSVLKSLNI